MVKTGFISPVTSYLILSHNTKDNTTLLLCIVYCVIFCIMSPAGPALTDVLPLGLSTPLK